MKNGFFSDVKPCGSCKNRRLREAKCIHHQGDKNRETSKNVSHTADIVPISFILLTLMMEALCSCETSFLTRATRRNIPEDSILRGQSSFVLFSFTSFVSVRSTSEETNQLMTEVLVMQ
jgi:hypothetical protein